MIALHATDMSPAEFWTEYVGSVSPREFLAQARTRRLGTPEELVRDYVARLPAVYGLVLRGTWRNTFSTYPYSREQVEGALVEYLEETRPDWEPAWTEAATAAAPEPPVEEMPDSPPAESVAEPDAAAEAVPEQAPEAAAAPAEESEEAPDEPSSTADPDAPPTAT